MQHFVYTYIDEFRVLRYDKIDADSVEDARKKSKERRGKGASIDGIWQRVSTSSEKGGAWVLPHSLYLRKKMENELVYCGPRSLLWGKLFFLSLAIGSLISGDILFSLVFVLLTAFCFIYRTIMTIQAGRVIYKMRYFGTVKERQLDISNATRILFEAKMFESVSGKCWRCFFVIVEKGGQEFLINSSPNKRAEKCMAQKISQVLNLPIEEIGS